MKKIISEMEFLQREIKDYLNNPRYIELLCELDNLQKLSYYETKNLENLDKIYSSLIGLIISLDRLNMTILKKS